MKKIRDLITSEHFKTYGYEIINANLLTEFEPFKSRFEKYFSEKATEFKGAPINFKDIGYYHDVIDSHEINHHEFIQSISRKLPSEFLNDPFIKSIVNSLSSFLNSKIKITDEIIWYRICRPNNDDSNDFHRDHWFPNYMDVLNLYVPIAGSYSYSAMKIVPKSHLWSDDDVIPTFSGDSGQKYFKNDVAYSAPGIKYCKHEISPHRPDTKPGNIMIFDPKIIHGGGDNFSIQTRISLEIRVNL
jgi:hypothetical protein